MPNRWLPQIGKVVTAAMVGVGALTLLPPQASLAGCNPWGCSAPGAGECNPWGCPNPGAGKCTPWGCPPSPAQPATAPSTQPTTVLIPAQSQIGGSPQAIAACMKGLMYEQKLVCTNTMFSCSSTPKDGVGGWKAQTVRSGISEAAAVQACQNAR